MEMRCLLILKDDVTTSCKGTDLPEEFQKVLQSIPMQKVTDDVMRELSIGNEVTILKYVELSEVLPFIAG